MRHHSDAPGSPGVTNTGGIFVKSMTCQDLGGPCSLEHRGDSADDVINAQDRHLKELVKAGDDAHVPAREDMKGRWRHPMKSMSWYNDVKKRFAALPES
jgi:predicted small metal-binding protein